MPLETEVEETVTLHCPFDNNKLNLPKYIIDEHGDAKKEYRGHTLDNGMHISSATGSVYCSRECLTKYCED